MLIHQLALQCGGSYSDRVFLLDLFNFTSVAERIFQNGSDLAPWNHEMERHKEEEEQKCAEPIRLAILQRVCPGYRTALFKRLTSDKRLQAKLFIGDDIPGSKVRNASNLEAINYEQLRTRIFRIGRRLLPWHVGLIGRLRRYDPDVILCEGESHFLGYLQAILYRTFFNRRAALIHWCFIALPGEPLQKPGVTRIVKWITRKFFDAFLLYSSYSKTALIQLGISENRAFVATNVGDVERFIQMSDALSDTPQQARARLSLPDRFTVLYAGTLDPNKRPDLLLDLAKAFPQEEYNFLILGTGDMLDSLKVRAQQERLLNVYFPGRVVDNLALYFRSADVLLMPGRGGIIMSEAMAFGLPVIAHQGDGTEYDLIENGRSGLRLEYGQAEDFKSAIEFLFHNRGQSTSMGTVGRRLIVEKFNTDNMTNCIFEAVSFAKESRSNDKTFTESQL